MNPGRQQVELERLREWPENPRQISPEALSQLRRSLEREPELLEARPLIALPDGTVIAGNMRLRALREMEVGEATVHVIDADHVRAREIALRDNNQFGDWDDGSLAAMIAELVAEGTDPLGLGFASQQVDALLASLQPLATEQGPTLADRFLIPPFSVLDSRRGPWQEREREWLALGIESEIGRGSNLLHMSDAVLDGYADPRSSRAGRAYDQSWLDRINKRGASWGGSSGRGGTSVFSAVLCELAYRWWSAPGARVLDPFAGGSVRGIVAALLEREYSGIDLSGDQIEANRRQAAEIVAPRGKAEPRWLEGDAAHADELLAELGAAPFDLVFSCPPYYDLEQYSDDPRDLSTMDAGMFSQTYALLIRGVLELLAEDRFAVFVVGDARDGHRQRSLVAETISAFEAAGAMHYNHAILVTPAGSAAIRATKIFRAGRKLIRTHQHVLVFCKGDPLKATEAAGEVSLEGVDFDQQMP